MAYIPCNYGSSGGTLSETVLWENPSPSSSLADGTITLTQPITNFDYIKVYGKRISTDSDDSHVAMLPVSDLQNCLSIAGGQSFAFVTAGGSSYPKSGAGRFFQYISSTQLKHQVSGIYGVSAESPSKYAVITRICGCK